MEHALTSVLSLPVLDRRVPTSIRLQSQSGDIEATEVCRERIQAGLAVPVPQRKKHKSAEDVLKEQFLAYLGPEPLSEVYLEFTVDLCGSEMRLESDDELGRHVALFPQENEIDIARPIATLERMQEGLGTKVFAQFAHWFDDGPGLISDRALFEMYNDFDLESSYGADDYDADELRERLLKYGSDPESVDAAMPEAVLAALGGKDLIYKNPPIALDLLCEKLQALKDPLLDALVKALHGVQDADKNYSHALNQCAGLAYSGSSYYEPIRLTAQPGEDCVQIRNIWDSMRNDAMNNGDYDAVFALNHVTKDFTPPKDKGSRRKPKPIVVDGMAIATHLVRYYSALDAALCVLQKIGAQDGLRNEPIQG